MTVLIYGLGSIAKKHIDAMLALWPDVEIYALRSQLNSPIYRKVINLYNDADREIKPDFIIISNPTALRAEALIRAAEFGVPLFIEKPALDQTAGADALSELLHKRGIASYVACNLRFHPCISTIRASLPQIGRINEVNIYCGSSLPTWRAGAEWRTNYSANAEMGGGVHLDLIHELDYCCWLFGRPESSRSYKSRASHLNISAIDYANFILAYPDFAANIVLNYFRKDTKRSLEIVAEDDTWLVDLVKNEVWKGDECIASFPDFKATDTYKLQLEYFYKQVSDGGRMMNSFDEALLPLSIALS